MPTYAIGDIQGCFAAFRRLLQKINYNAKQDKLWLAGDLVNRGPDSLETLRWIKELGDRAVTVLGNHDMHLLAVAEGVGKKRAVDTFEKLLSAPDKDELIGWLRRRPLMYVEGDFVLVHAGIHPHWTVERARELSSEVENALRVDTYHEFLNEMYGNEPRRFDDNLKGTERLRFIANTMTRMRVVTQNGDIDLNFTGKPENAPEGTTPWHETPGRLSADKIIVCGHWAAQGVTIRKNLIAIDSGCGWGGRLSAVRLDDRSLFQVSCGQV